jgi:diacylglycerol kinase (ATP)
MRACLIWNPLAGQHLNQQPLQTAIETLQAGGWSLRTLEIARPGDGTWLARRAVEEGADVVIAAGGDGTVNAIVNGLVGSDVPLGVLPMGTGNVWAKQLGLPAWVLPYRHPLREAAQGLLEATVHSVDVGCANGRYFLLWAGIGIDAEVAHEVEPLVELRQRLGNVLYAITGLTVALNFVGTRSTLAIDGQIVRQRVVLVVVANAQLYGGGLVHLAPLACIDDGYLDVFVFRGHGPAATVHHLFSLLSRYHMRDPQMSYYRARQIDIYAERPMAVQIDGEASGSTPLRVQVVQRALKVLVPPTAPLSLFSEGIGLEANACPSGARSRPCA